MKEIEQTNITRIAAKVASETAIKIYTEAKQKEQKLRSDRRLRDTKRLMKSYREIKIHAGDAIASLAEVNNEDFDFFHELLEERVSVSAIVLSKAKSAIMLAHIEAMLRAYQAICYGSKKPEDARRYRVLESMYIVGEPVPAQEIADRENIDTRTVYKDLDAACEKMSALLFGVQWIERE